MCFNISIVSNANVIEYQFNAQFHTDFTFEPKKHISAFTNPTIPVITSENQHKIQPLYWGLIPHWVKDSNHANQIRRMTYNAKSETIAVKPSFRDAFKKNRCLVIVDGFYEWQSTTSGKICHYIQSNNCKLFAFAGIYSEWIDKLSGEYIKSVSILTQSANSMMAKIHNIKKRQPVIINPKQYEMWLKSNIEYDNILDMSFNVELNSKIVDSPLST